MITFTEKLAKYRIATNKERRELILEWGEPVGESEKEIQITLDIIYQSNARAYIVQKANEPAVCSECGQEKRRTPEEVQDAITQWSDRLLNNSYRDIKDCYGKLQNFEYEG
jgi:hypothetical protein